MHSAARDGPAPVDWRGRGAGRAATRGGWQTNYRPGVDGKRDTVRGGLVLTVRSELGGPDSLDEVPGGEEFHRKPPTESFFVKKGPLVAP